MNKTVTINISGIIFHIEEDAYDSLSKYLSTIKGYFSKTDGGNEIMSDIEARIAELLQARINASKQVILMADVNYVMDIMGKPEEFGAEQSRDEQASNTQNNAEYTGEKIKRRLFRDPDQRIVGGVCSGLAAYFDVDTVWIRLAMFLLVFFGFSLGFWIYIVMWIIVPQAKTMADKLAMRGEAANINTILKSFQEEGEEVKNRFQKYGHDFKNGNYGENLRSSTSHALNIIFNILGRLLGAFLLFIGGLLLFGYIMALFGISWVENGSEDLTKWKHVIFESGSDYGLAVFAFIIVLGIPIFMLIYSGIKLLFRIRYSNRWLNMGLGVLWAIGLVMGFYVAMMTLKSFGEYSRIKESTELRNVGDTLVIKMNPALSALKTQAFDSDDDLEQDMKYKYNGYYFMSTSNKLSIVGYADLNVVENTSDSIEMIITRTARGGSKKEANENAKSINYAYHQNGRELVFDQVFYTNAGSKFRAPELDIKIKLPKGKVIYFDKSVKHLLNDVDNTTNTWDGDMINRRWKMTDKGLECLDCKSLHNIGDDSNNDDDDSDDIKTKNITINDNGIKVNGKDAEIKIDENGIRIKTPEKEIEVRDDKGAKGDKGQK